MPTYGPHNLRWLAGPDAADELAALANPMSIGGRIPEEVFGFTKAEMPPSVWEYLSQFRPVNSAMEEVGGMLEDYARPRFIQDMLANMDKKPMGKGRQLYDAGLNALLKLMKHAQNLGNSPEAVSATRRTIPAFIKGERDADR